MISSPERCASTRTMLATAVVASALLLPAAAAGQASPDGAAWNPGVEVAGSPGVLLRWERSRASWIFGVGAGVGPGGEHVRVRATPAARVGRALPGGFRVDAGLGFEWARLERRSNHFESEIQWEITGGWSWASVLRAEAGLRWTDYRNRRTEALFRLGLARVGSDGPEPTPRVGDALPDFGIPPALTSHGLVLVGVDASERAGSGFVAAAANPRGDPSPGSAGTTAGNIDRLGLGMEAWSRRGPIRAWVRWRSDLHTDPSIRERIRPIADGLSFPVSVSFSGGVRWGTSAGGVGLSARHDPQAFLWIPHLSAERTAAVDVLEADAAARGFGVRVSSMRLGAVAGQTLDPLGHLRIQATYGTSIAVGAEHERLALGERVATRSRATAERTGRFFGRLSAGDDVVLALGAREFVEGWRTEARVGYRSRPELLDYDALLARGWLGSGAQDGTMDEAPVFDATLSAGRGALELGAAAVWSDPIWMGDAVRRGDGGSVHAAWADTLAGGRLEAAARVLLGRWGSPFGWWQEEPALSAFGRAHLIDGILRLSADLKGRSALRSVRSGLAESGGAELGVALTGPLPHLGPFRGMLGEARLEDVLDAGLPTRVGAPRRGRRLVLLVTLTSDGDDPH